MQPDAIIMLLATGFEEIEAITILDVLRRAEINVQSCSIDGTQEVTGAHGICVKTDTDIARAAGQNFKMIILPGGAVGVENLLNSEPVASLLISNKESYLAAICAAPSALAVLGLAKDYTMTSYPSFRQKVMDGGAIYSEDRVIVDRNRLSSRGPGTSMEFALKLVEFIKNKETASELAKGMLVNQT